MEIYEILFTHVIFHIKKGVLLKGRANIQPGRAKRAHTYHSTLHYYTAVYKVGKQCKHLRTKCKHLRTKKG